MRRFARTVLQQSVVFVVVLGNVAVWLGSEGIAAEREEQLRFFESKVRPLLIARCGKCHGEQEQESKLRLDSPDAIRQGGTSGPAIVPGKPEQSLLITAIGYRDENLRMPPEGKLSATEVADLTQWVRDGAVMPGGGGGVPAPLKSIGDEQLARGREFWSFRTPVLPELPTVQDRRRLAGPLDAFVLAPLEAKQLTPTPLADKLTLLRRATYDLTGLPPRPQDVADFTADAGPDAYARRIDRLLASPSYGERWGRHWLDVARYSDSNGLDENVAHGNAWRYRDYVVSALNRDLPYDQFLREQLAGDLLAPTEDRAIRNERLIATGFLALGPKVLAEVDERKMEMDIIDEQIDTLGKSLLGLTLGCCRCHDHKYDPIGQADYYALAGIFKSTRTMEHFKKVARWHENPIPTAEQEAQRAEHDRRVAEHKQALDKFIAEATARAKEQLKPGEELPKNAEAAFPTETKAELKRRRDELAALEKSAPVVPSAMGASEGAETDVAIHVRGSHLTLGQTMPRRFPRVMSTSDAQPLSGRSGRLELAEWLVHPDHPLTARVMVNRVWRWHFGQGIVSSTDNFGLLGERPTNQPLLDWLARQFIAEQWSLKNLHRTILLSATYQQSSAYDARNAAVDPENRLRWRADVRRLEAESIRDAILAASGSLDHTMGGSLLHVKNREYLFDHTSKDGTKYDSPRRSIYLPVIRNNLYDVFQLFDYADASVMNGSRDTTTVAPQALFMLNSELVTRAADTLAGELLATDNEDSSRIVQLYLRVFAREPSEAERARALAWLSQFTTASPVDPVATRRAWAWLCQSMLASNEFIYVR